jgi:hypothetical protein
MEEMYKLKNVTNLQQAEMEVAEITIELEKKFLLGTLQLQQWGSKQVIYEARPTWGNDKDFLVEVQIPSMDIYAKVVGDDIWVPLGTLTNLVK